MGEFEILRDALLLTVLWNFFFYSLGQAVFPWTAKICIGNYINNFSREEKSEVNIGEKMNINFHVYIIVRREASFGQL